MHKAHSLAIGCDLAYSGQRVPHGVLREILAVRIFLWKRCQIFYKPLK